MVDISYGCSRLRGRLKNHLKVSFCSSFKGEMKFKKVIDFDCMSYSLITKISKFE